jgi:hypothetical protein
MERCTISWSPPRDSSSTSTTTGQRSGRRLQMSTTSTVVSGARATFPWSQACTISWGLR